MPESADTLGPYRLIEQIGTGRRGPVWKARHDDTGDDVALRILPESLLRDPRRLSGYRQAIEAAAGLKHPAVLPSRWIEGVEPAAVAMPFVRGGSLVGRVPSGGISLQPFLGIARGLTDALAAAHEQALTHRDLRLGSFLMNERQQVRVHDFGLAWVREREGEETTDPDDAPTMTMTGDTLRSAVPYMSPEHVQGRPLDARSDVFSLGAILYEVATGNQPFAGESSADVIVGVLRDEPEPVTRFNPRLPEEVGTVLARCLSKESDARYASAREIHAALAALG